MTFGSKLSRFVDRDVSRPGPLGGGLSCLSIGAVLAAAPTAFLEGPYGNSDMAIASAGVLLSVIWLYFITWRATLLLRGSSSPASPGSPTRASDGRGPLVFLAKSLDRWSRQMESGLGQLARGKTFGARLGGDNKTDRVEAKYLLLAFVPFIPFGILDRVDWAGSLIWYAWTSISCAWFIFLAPLVFAGLWRYFR